MTKIKTNWRKVATIIACLTVTTMFAACDSSNPNDDEDGNPVGGDPKLVVEDCWMTGFGVGLSSMELYFKVNGEFVFELYWTFSNNSPMYEEIYKGTYSASKGVLTLTFKSAQHKDVFNDKDWESISLPRKLSLPYTVGYNEHSFYLLEIEGALPGVPERYEEDGMSFYIWKDGQIYTP